MTSSLVCLLQCFGNFCICGDAECAKRSGSSTFQRINSDYLKEEEEGKKALQSESTRQKIGLTFHFLEDSIFLPFLCVRHDSFRQTVVPGVLSANKTTSVRRRRGGELHHPCGWTFKKKTTGRWGKWFCVR